ncbi:MAG TPA: carbohydrate ABC transporter permease [Chloroflexota bacterium]|nr:carbohydrate ABC transporter permease [Chloroflexota bacterium]
MYRAGELAQTRTQAGHDFGRQAGVAAHYALLTVVAVLFLAPLVWLCVSSLRPTQEIFRYVSPLSWRTFWPEVPTLEGFTRLMSGSFPRAMLNSAILAIATVIGGVAANALAAYAFARIGFPGRDLLFGLFLVTIMIPFEVTLIPLFVIMKSLGWVDTYQGLILPGIVNPFAVFLLRQFFLEIPKDVEDASRIDGCSRLGTFWRVVLPMSIPALITVALISFQAGWDAFLWPLVVTNSEALRVAQVAVAMLIGGDAAKWDQVFVASVVLALPSLVLFLSFQRFYVRSGALSGLKG